MFSSRVAKKRILKDKTKGGAMFGDQLLFIYVKQSS